MMHSCSNVFRKPGSRAYNCYDNDDDDDEELPSGD